MMSHPKIFPILLLSSLLLLFISHGFGEEVKDLDLGRAGYVSSPQKESAGKPRKMMMEVMDYADPGPNTNTRSGYLSPPPPSP